MTENPAGPWPIISTHECVSIYKLAVNGLLLLYLDGCSDRYNILKSMTNATVHCNNWGSVSKLLSKKCFLLELIRAPEITEATAEYRGQFQGGPPLFRAGWLSTAQVEWPFIRSFVQVQVRLRRWRYCVWKKSPHKDWSARICMWVCAWVASQQISNMWN